EAERAGAGEEVEHARASDRVVVTVSQDVEERFAQAVAGRPDRLRLRRRQRAPAEPAADDAHSAPARRPWAGWTRAGRAGRGTAGAECSRSALARPAFARTARSGTIASRRAFSRLETLRLG